MSNMPNEPRREEKDAAGRTPDKPETNQDRTPQEASMNADAQAPQETLRDVPGAPLQAVPAGAPSPVQMKRSLAKNIRLVILIIGGMVVLGLAVLLALYFFLPEQETPAPEEYYFYPVNWNENIFETGEYPESDRIMMYCDNEQGYGLKEQITSDGSDMENFDIKVRFLTIYLNSIISGDVETYRSLFTESYLQANSIPQFTQQMLYQMCIYYCGTEALEGGMQRVTYRVDYMIRKNNGTFRRDVGSDAIRPQYVVLLVSPDGSDIAIENVYTRS